MRCIICATEKSPDAFTDEHVFPEAIGGTLVARNVCKPCNDRLGTEVDCHLADHVLVQGQRMLMGIAGKSGKVPNPIERGTLGDDASHKLIYKMGPDGKPAHLYTVPLVRHVENSDGTKTVQIRVDKSDAALIPEIVNKVLKRAGRESLSDSEIERVMVPTRVEKPWMHVNFPIDLVHYQRGILKIAYELACRWLGEGYVDDPTGTLIRACMFDTALPVEWHDKHPIRAAITFMGDGSVYPFWRDESNSHLAFLMRTHEGVACYVRVFEVIEGYMLVCDNLDAYPQAQPMFLTINPRTGAVREVLMSDEVTRLATGPRR